MALLLGLLAPIRRLNDFVLAIGRAIAVGALGLMVLVILLQIFMRYVLNNALPWPEEAARFLMLWMTGLVAPSAYRQGGFVAIDMLERAVSSRLAALLSLALILIGFLVLIVGINLGLNHVNSGWLFASSSLKLPLGLIGGTTVKIKLAWMYMSLLVGVILLTIVNIELLLRALITLFGGSDQLPPLGEVEDADMAGAS